MKYKKLCLLLFSVICLFINIGIITHAEELDFKCGTDTQLVQKLHSELIQKKLSELNTNYSLWSNEISLFSIHFAVFGRNYMPSTGDVKILTVPIEFKDDKFNVDISNQLQTVFFEKHDIEKT